MKKQGIIQAMSGDGKRFKLDDGEWYGCMFESAMCGAKRGDTVEFEYQQVTKGTRTYNNVRGSVSVLITGAAAAAPLGAGGVPVATGPGPGYLEPQISRQRSIIRQNAVTSAIAYLVAQGEPFTMEQVMEVARSIEYYTSGDADILAVEQELDNGDVSAD